ncbi:MarR family winged helix-turn-helix transcriptional regulator [Maricaulis sp.]|uniref:MarR family winged helix-turn-helix transcriptional regulator n=1 Tax=Maricaulis sp. TaxID=1486257 RepID=UPI003A912AE8
MTPLMNYLERLSRLMLNEGHADGLKPAQWEALRFLALANRFSRTAGGLGAYLGLTKGTVSQTLNALERKGLVARSTDGQDRRRVQLAVTPAGRALIDRDPLGELSDAIDHLPRPERDRLAASLETVLRAWLTQRGGRSFAQCLTCRHFRDRAPLGAPHYCALLNQPLRGADSLELCIEHEVPAAGQDRAGGRPTPVP